MYRSIMATTTATVDLLSTSRSLVHFTLGRRSSNAEPSRPYVLPPSLAMGLYPSSFIVGFPCPAPASSSKCGSTWNITTCHNREGYSAYSAGYRVHEVNQNQVGKGNKETTKYRELQGGRAIETQNHGEPSPINININRCSWLGVT